MGDGMAPLRQAQLLHHDAHLDGTPLSREERESIIKPYLPSPRQVRSTDVDGTHKHGTFTRTSRSPQALFQLLVHRFLFLLIQITVVLTIRSRQTYHACCDRVLSVLYYHHRTPELIRRDVRGLGKIPKHLSVIVDLRDGKPVEALQALVGEVAELASWCVCVGIKQLSVYERTGALQSHAPALYRETAASFDTYFSHHRRPGFYITAPNRPAYSPSPSRSRASSPSPSHGLKCTEPSLDILLLSSHDGRDTIVDLAKTIAEMAQKGKVSPTDVTTDLIHAEIEESCGLGEPDLLVVMTGPAPHRQAYARDRRQKTKCGYRITPNDPSPIGKWDGSGICLQGYPPWQVRLTEIFHVQDSKGVGYQVFLRALHRYAKAEMRFGR